MHSYFPVHLYFNISALMLRQKPLLKIVSPNILFRLNVLLVSKIHIPVIIHITERNNYILGDDLYPKDPDFTGERKPVLTTNKNIEELMKEVKNLHRIVIRSLNNVTVHMNIESKYKHINPVTVASKM